MPRSRGSEISQKHSPRVPLHLKSTAASEANSLHRPISDRSSPRSSPLVEKKRGNTRVAELEAKLSQMEEELKKVKEQLATAEAAKNSHQELGESPTQSTTAVSNSDPEENPIAIQEPMTQNQDPPIEPVTPVVTDPPATDVFEVVPPVKTQDQDRENETEKISEIPIDPEIVELRAMLAAKEAELETRMAENESIVENQAAVARAKEGEMAAEILTAKAEAENLAARLEAAEGEMRRMRVQTEQWRKAAEAAAAEITGGEGRRVAERCGSMDKQHLSGYGYGYGFSPLAGGEMEEGGGGKRRGGGGIRMFGDLWRKKGGN